MKESKGMTYEELDEKLDEIYKTIPDFEDLDARDLAILLWGMRMDTMDSMLKAQELLKLRFTSTKTTQQK